MDILTLFLLTIPIFYIYGLSVFIVRIFRGSQKPNSANVTEENTENKLNLIKSLKNAAVSTPDKTVKQFVEDYEKSAKEPFEKSAEPLPQIEIKSKSIKQDDNIFGNWYKNNSVNLLLYIGAFLIVSSGAIFVGFQWDAIAGITKAMLLMLLAIGFLAFGLWFYTLPKIKNAGSTFIAIFAILIPVLGSAWYNFVLKDLGINAGIAWFFTSFVAVIVYIFFAIRFKNIFYSYASTITTFSLCISFVSALNLNKDFYILAAIIANFILLSFQVFFKNQGQFYSSFFSTPSKLSSQILMPLTLVYGFFVALSQNKLFSLEAVLSLILTSVFYYLSYKISNKKWQLALSEALIPFTVILFFNWRNLSNLALFYCLNVCSLTYSLVAYWFLTKKKQEELNFNLLYSVVLSIIVILFSWNSVEPVNQIVFTFSSFFIGVFAVIFLKKDVRFLFLSTFSVAAFAYNAQINIYKNPNEYLIFSFIPIGIISYFLTYKYRVQKNLLLVLSSSTIFYFLISLVASTGREGFFLYTTFIITIVFLSAAYFFKKSLLSFGATSFGLIALLTFLNISKVYDYYYPLAIIGYAYVLYLVNLLLPNNYKNEFRSSSLVIGVLNIVFYGATSFPKIFADSVEKSALISSYLATALFGFDTWFKKEKNFGYVTSVIAMATFLWQLKFSGITNSLMYTASLGFYFVALAFTRKLKKDPEGQKILDTIGLILLIVPSLFLSFGENPVKYSIFLGVIGILFIALGISFAYNLYKYAGIAGIVLAVLPQTYNFILSLPRWIIVGGVGITFLIVAIFILLKRKDEH